MASLDDLTRSVPAPDSPTASQILVNRLTARRMDTKRARRRTDFWPVRNVHHEADIFMQEAEASDVTPLATHARFTRSLGPSRLDPSSSSDPAAAAAAAARNSGLKAMDEKLQRLERQNFDLKMEVHHRREREERLHQQLRSMHDQVILARRIQDEHKTLLRVNRQLTEQLDKSDEAVEQAVQMICDLETQLEALQRPATKLTSSSLASDSGYGGSESLATTVIHPTPPRKRFFDQPGPAPAADSHHSHLGGTSRGQRIPSFVSDTGSNTAALREAYAGSGRQLRQTLSFVSVVSESTAKDDNIELASPHLSALSESSFPSIYDLKKDSVASDGVAMGRELASLRPEEEASHHHHEHAPSLDSIERVTDWMQSSTASQAETDGHPRRSHQHPPPVLSDDWDDGDEATRPSTGSSTSTSTGFFAGYPDGGSIVTGTPSRFRARTPTARESPKGDDNHNNSKNRPTADTTPKARTPTRRRNSSAAAADDLNLHLASPVRARPSPTQQRPRHRTSLGPVDGAHQQPTTTTTTTTTDTTEGPTTTNNASSKPARRSSTLRASLAAQGHRLWGRLSIGGAVAAGARDHGHAQPGVPATAAAAAAADHSVRG